MRLEIVDTADPRHLALNYKAARERLLTAQPKPKPAPVILKPLPDFVDPMSILWSMRLNAKRGIMFRYGNLAPGMSLTKICEAVCRHFGITNTDLCSHRRQSYLTKPRHIVAYLSRKYTGRSMPEIGRWLGNRDHTTILNSLRRIGKEPDRFMADIEAIERYLMVR